MSGTYQVKALINGISLDECSIVSSGDQIRPYFASSITNDPDITGLMVFLENSRGEVLGGTVQYVLKPDAPDPVVEETETRPVEEAPGSENSENQEAATETPEHTPPAGTDSAAQQTGTENRADEDILIPVKRLDKELPYFSFTENLDIGQYTLVFEVLGGKEQLQRTEKSVYFLNEARFEFRDIQKYLPGLAAGSQLVPPGAAILLEARLEFDPRMDPYIVWYYGKKIISEGAFSSGAGTILWEAPEQNGFHSLRAEVFPSPNRLGIAGISRQFSLPVSSKAASAYMLSGSDPDLLHWYQFKGDLKDSKHAGAADWALIPRDEKAARWLPVDSSYGLAAGPNDVYQLPPVSFIQDGMKEGGGQIIFRVSPVSGGDILGAGFALTASPVEMVTLNLRLQGESLVLALGGPGIPNEEISENLAAFGTGAYITGVIEFSIWPDWFEARLRPWDSVSPAPQDTPDQIAAPQNDGKTLGLAVALNGKCGLIFGASAGAENNSAGAGELVPDGQSEQTGGYETAAGSPLISAVLNELALVYAAPRAREAAELTDTAAADSYLEETAGEEPVSSLQKQDIQEIPMPPQAKYSPAEDQDQIPGSSQAA